MKCITCNMEMIENVDNFHTPLWKIYECQHKYCLANQMYRFSTSLWFFRDEECLAYEFFVFKDSHLPYIISGDFNVNFTEIWTWVSEVPTKRYYASDFVYLPFKDITKENVYNFFDKLMKLTAFV